MNDQNYQSQASDNMMRILFSAVTIWCFLIANATLATFAAADEKPNLIFIMADDLGFGDLGCYGQKIIKTPRLDQMAREGMRFQNFYAGCTVCAPSRCVLMTGKHMGHAHVRGNAGNNFMIQCLRDEDVTVAEIFKSAGYKTALCGKWGLGEVREEADDNPGLPNHQGFDYFYGYQNQVHAHNYYPEFLWRNREKIPLRNIVKRNKSRPGAKTFVGGYATKRVDYSHDLILEEGLNFIKENKDDPFFLYLSLTIPHANNEGTRGTGDGQEVPEYGIYSDENWPNQDKGQAAMITRMDRGVGQILDLLEQLKIDERTIVMFTSDNGHHNEGGHNPDRFDPNGPLRGKKRDLYEGGIRVPLIARWPGHIKADSVSDHISYFGDLMQTVCELTGAEPPKELDSISFLPELTGRTTDQKQHRYLYWEFYEQGGKQAVRQGRWKAVRMPMHTGAIQLFDLDADLGESTDVAEANPETVAQLSQFMDEAHTPHPNWKVRGQQPRRKR